MPSTNQYDARVLSYVKPFSSASFAYGFKTNAKEATRTACGVVVITGAIPENLVVGCDAPKPGRASRFATDEYESSFYDHSKYTALRAANWATTRPSVRVAKASALSKPVYITIKGIKYAWRMSAAQYTNITSAERTALGITDVTAGERTMVWGCREPKPPKVGKTAGGNTISTFCDPTKLDSLPEGWQSLGGSKTTIDPSS